ncbi:uncharacterized protein LOC108094022 [Drosophila ficusphila]|uniref:uncharacterized protein LOC108094022 n=1 Tax=Drosophila ficusphila TaxID=30025 RepID=UPI0007E86678|nr:uncharacterized protein LOC108094022 [Drosophila ficusphila]
MVLVRGMYETSELAAGCIGCGGLYMAGCNLLPMQHVPDLPAALFVLSVVVILHHLRVVSLPPLKELWRLLLELVVLYLCTQGLVLIVWQQFHSLIDTLRDAALSTRMAMDLLGSHPKVFMFLRQDLCYFGKLLVSLLCAYHALTFASALDYAIPQRRSYRYYEDLTTNENFANERNRSTKSKRKPSASKRPTRRTKT